MKKLIYGVVLVSALFLGACGNETDVNKTPAATQLESENAGKSETSDSTDSTGKEKEDTTTSEEDKGIKEGTYKIGTDLEAGEYLIISNSLMGYVEVTKDSTGALESIIYNANLTQNGHMYATVADGEYLKVTGSTIYKVNEAPSVVPKDGVYKNGQYKVGVDIPAGEYKYVLDSALGLGYVEVSKSSRHNLLEIVTNDNPQADGYITVTDGQYLTLQDVYIEVK